MRALQVEGDDAWKEDGKAPKEAVTKARRHKGSTLSQKFGRAASCLCDFVADVFSVVDPVPTLRIEFPWSKRGKEFRGSAMT